MKLIDSYGWIEYFTDGPLADKYAPYVLNANEKNTVTPSIVVYEVYRRLKKEKGEEVALEAYAQITNQNCSTGSGFCVTSRRRKLERGSCYG